MTKMNADLQIKTGLRYKQLAEKMNVSVGWVKARQQDEKCGFPKPDYLLGIAFFDETEVALWVQENKTKVFVAASGASKAA
tara:strand:+ start:65 stop:307 length:243 start_codon:yes stop_codon:yes gene_type:complete